MKRITIRNSDGSVSQPTDMEWSDALEKLAAYEDTGFEPEEVTKLIELRKRNTEILCGLEYERFTEILNAESEGRLLVLPCKVGDTVYLIEQVTRDVKCIFDARVNGISVSYAGVVNLHFGGYPPLSHCASSIGNTVFLTREEAEAVLKKECNDG